jgi:hypothetical protein
MLKVQRHINQTVDSIYRSYLSNYEKAADNKILLKHEGEFSVHLIRILAENVETLMTEFGESRQMIKRMFSILIEGLQNIHLHGGHENGIQRAFLIIAKNNTGYKITFGNILDDQEDKVAIKACLNDINHHTEKEIKDLYLSKLKNGFLTLKGGAGLGIVTMRIKSSNDLYYQFYPLDADQSFLVLEVELNEHQFIS